ncbi:putative elongation factor Tu [Ordospora pajunii]|uniref:putative elongation factor Tu n=1 Tax=Ordospora pajunii TaxID=3039483 RepID=UPI0029527F58|nr:putative elongation factor Tu [Ordospora pajunii]KAH9410815.1 putative elongation factor Tu [Ordospora pajunii]
MSRLDWKDARIVDQTVEILGPKESLYTKTPGPISAESRDLSYFHVVSQSQSRKTVAGLFGYGSAGKTTLIKTLGMACNIRGASVHAPTETLYEREREATLHVHPMVAFLSGKHTPSHVLTLIDTSGHADMIFRTIQMIECVDIAIVLIDVTGHLSLCHRVLLDAIRMSGKPSVVILNKIDAIADDNVSSAEKVTKAFMDLICNALGSIPCLIASLKNGWIRVIDGPFDNILADGISNGTKKHAWNDVADVLVGIISKSMSNCIKQKGLTSILGFTLFEDVVLCSLIADEKVCAGSLLDVNGKEMTVENIYIPVCGCLVETDCIGSGIGVLIRFDQDEVLSTSHAKTGYSAENIVKLIESELCRLSLLDMLKPLKMAGCLEGVIKVKVSADDQSLFESGIKKLKIVYYGLTYHTDVLGGPGEAFLDAVLHDLRAVLGIRFEVVAVFCDLKEAIVNEFEMDGESNAAFKINGYANGKADCNQFKGIEMLVNIGPVLGKQLNNSYVEVLHRDYNEKAYLSTEHASKGLLNEILDVVKSSTKFLEPMCLMEIVYMEDAKELVCEMICMSKGQTMYESVAAPSGMRSRMCLLPIAECFGFESDLRNYSCCLADCTMIPFCWNVLDDVARLNIYTQFMDTINSMHKEQCTGCASCATNSTVANHAL